MRFMNRQQSEILDKLVYLADGDTALVEEAMRACTDESDGVAPLGRVIDYIERHRDRQRHVA